MKIDDLDTPVLLVDKDALERNVSRMQTLVKKGKIAYRPHAKAHKSPEIAKIQLNAGACGVCCAKLGEAEVMAANGIKDILITTPVIGISKLSRMMQIANQAKVSVVVDNQKNVEEMNKVAKTFGVRPDVVIEVDVGQGRCGVAPGEQALVLAKGVMSADWLNFKGLQGYQGNIQMTRSFSDREIATRHAASFLNNTAKLIKKDGIPVNYLTGGGSGTSVIDAKLAGLTELQPGGYIFMDSRYREIEWDNGKNIPFEQSLMLLTSVISMPKPGYCVLDMGLKAVSSDGGNPSPIDLPSSDFQFAGEEHSALTFKNGGCPLKLGAKVLFSPSHCDTTVNLYDNIIAVRRKDVVEVWKIAARGRTQ